jgi:hypothetical protein
MGDGKSARVEADRNAGGFDRNSGAYFRRLSMLPISTISKAVPIILLNFVNAIRGILFSLSQVYSALRQFVVFASQNRLSAQLSQSLNEADGTMSLLINALDRFDSVSRRGTPDSRAVQDVFVKCKGNVVTFGTLVATLGLQLKELVATADIRYARTLLLMLYGSMGEISNSWNAVSGFVEEVSMIVQPVVHDSPGVLSGASNVAGSNGVYRARSKTRRHAGSFSVEDVQLGAVLVPSTTILSTNSATNSTTPSNTNPSLPNDSSSSSIVVNATSTFKSRPTKINRPLGFTLPLPPASNHPRQIIHNAFDQPGTPLGDPLPSTPSRNGDVKIASSADEKFLEMVESTTKIAFDVYSLLIESLASVAHIKLGLEEEDGILGTRRTRELMELCELGNETTRKLKLALDRVKKVQEGVISFSSGDAKRLGDEAYGFVQVSLFLHHLISFVVPKAGLNRLSSDSRSSSKPFRRIMGSRLESEKESDN